MKKWLIPTLLFMSGISFVQSQSLRIKPSQAYSVVPLIQKPEVVLNASGQDSLRGARYAVQIPNAYNFHQDYSIPIPNAVPDTSISIPILNTYKEQTHEDRKFYLTPSKSKIIKIRPQSPK